MEAQQQEIEGTRPLTAKVLPESRAYAIVMDSAQHIALSKLKAELEAMQKQHPNTAGLTIAIAVVARRAAEAQLLVSRAALMYAAKKGLPLEGYGLELDFQQDGLHVLAIPGAQTETRSA